MIAMKMAGEKPMQKLIAVLLMAGVIAVAQGQETDDDAGQMEAGKDSSGGQASLRGLTQLDVTKKADSFKRVPKDRSPYVSDYVYQPPLIPHRIRGYEISTNANKCLSCHSFRRARDAGATKISVTHYGTREGRVLSDVSPRRYFCLQCHVTQSDAAVLVENDFKRVDSLR
jgi:cytochrome c-type protein NapB